MQMIDFERDIEKKMKDVGWSLDFIYLEDAKNRFQMQSVGEDFVKEAGKKDIVTETTTEEVSEAKVGEEKQKIQ